ncbi:hypothetical protein [Sorangium atrum]|uniref:Uncharacterized protein n=1 Tax=Sorangium atrum TaxID=2995308 RepID=A0ABT5C545_9BACT|nr:hypothetical protein [Sorangium aterium]MDC0681540.1 hypothetical protein [Sorangium aterium]
MENKQWMCERTWHGFVVGTQPLTELAPGGVRSFGAHIHRRGRLIPGEHEIHFADPFLFSPMNRAHVERDVYRVIAIFPECTAGWTLSTPLPDGDFTSRTVTWEFSYDAQGVKQLSATARASVSDASMLLYDDILAELHVLVGRGVCGHPFDDADLLRKIRYAGQGFIQDITAPVLGISELSWRERLLRLRAAQEAMAAERVSFSRNIRGNGPSPVMLLQGHGSPNWSRADALLKVTDFDAVGPSQHGNGQQVAQSSIGRDLIQITHIHAAPALEETSSMPERPARGEGTPMPKKKPEMLGQVVEDASSGGRITQQTDAGSDAQAIRRVQAGKDIAQKKSAAAQMSFSFGRATGAGVIALTVAFLAWLAYQYLTH